MIWQDAKKPRYVFAAPESFLDANGFTRSTNYCNEKCIEKILKSGTFASWGYDSQRENVPYLDHALLYKNPKTQITCLVYITYYDPEDIQDEVKKWAESKGLKAEIYKESWYNEMTCTVIISLPDAKLVFDGNMCKR